MPSSIGNPHDKRSGRGIPWIAALVAVCFAAFLVYKLMPNLVATLFPGRNGFGGEWVGLAQYQPDRMGPLTRPAAIRFTLTPTRLANAVPLYTMRGELQAAGTATPITFSANEIIGGHELGSLDGQLSAASDAGLASATVSGTLKDGRLVDFQMQGLGKNVSATVKATLQKGSDTDFRELLNKLH